MNKFLAKHIGRKIFRPVQNQGDVYQIIKLLPDSWLEYARFLLNDRIKHEGNGWPPLPRPLPPPPYASKEKVQ